MHGLTWSKLNYCAWFVLMSVSSLPLSVIVNSCHACINLSRLRSSGFTPTLRSAVAFTDTTAGWAYRIHETTRGSRSFGLHEIFKCGHLNFMVYSHKQASRHTHNFCKCSHESLPNYLQKHGLTSKVVWQVPRLSHQHQHRSDQATVWSVITAKKWHGRPMDTTAKEGEQVRSGYEANCNQGSILKNEATIALPRHDGKMQKILFALRLGAHHSTTLS